MKIEKILVEEVIGNTDVDFYVPISIEFPCNYDKYGISDVCYYRYMNSESSFIEVVINRKEKKIMRVVIVSINNKVEKMEEDLFLKLMQESVAGNPEICMECFSESNIITEETKISFKCFEKQIFVLFNEKIKEGIFMDDLFILLGEGKNIVGFGIKELEEKELLILKETCDIVEH